jgi:hypothetical protein
MTHAIIRGKNGRRHEVDFGDAPVRVEVYANAETVEIFVEADFETHAEGRRRPHSLMSHISDSAHARREHKGKNHSLARIEVPSLPPLRPDPCASALAACQIKPIVGIFPLLRPRAATGHAAARQAA